MPGGTTTAAVADFGGSWDGYLYGEKSDYRVRLDLAQGAAGEVTGRVVSIRQLDGVSASWNCSGTVAGDRVVLTPGEWIARPDSSGERDTVTIVNENRTRTASFVDPREPDQVWSMAILSEVR